MLNSFRIFVLATFTIGFYFAYNDPMTARMRNKRAAVPTTSNIPIQCTTAGFLGITIDEGPTTTFTPLILDLFKKNGVKATFHVSTEWITNQLVVTILRRTISEGHVLGLRYRPAKANMTLDEIKTDIISQTNAIAGAVGVYTRYVRFPYGTLTADINNMLIGLGFTATNWNIDTVDYLTCTANSGYTSATMVNYYNDQFNLFKNAGGAKGAFISLHHDNCNISDGLALVLKSVAQFGYSPVTLDKCLGHADAYKQAADQLYTIPTSTGTTTTSDTSNTNSNSGSGTSGTTTNSGTNTAPTNAGSSSTKSSATGVAVNSALLIICLVASIFGILL